MDKYKLIIFGADWDVYEIAYRELIDDPHITYIPTFRPKGLLGQIQRIQFNPKLNHIVNMPGKHLWTPYYLRHEKGSLFCFLIMEKWLRHESATQLLPYLKKNYPKAKIVCFVQDLITTIIDKYTNKQINVAYIKKYANLLISYDEEDAQRHGALYHPTVFSNLKLPSVGIDYDLYFLGRDKGRLNTLIAIVNRMITIIIIIGQDGKSSYMHMNPEKAQIKTIDIFKMPNII